MIASLRRADGGLDLHVVAGADGPLIPALKDVGATATLLPMPRSLASIGESALVGCQQPPSRWRTAFTISRVAGGVSAYALRLHRAIQRLKPDIIHSNGNKFHLLIRLALGGKWPAVWHLHDFLGERPISRHLARRAAGNVGCFIAVSEAVARDAQSVLGSMPIEVIPNGVDLERFSPGPAEGPMLDRLSALPPATSIVRIGLVATYAHWKGHGQFLKAAARLPANLPVRFYIVGGPIYQTAGSQFTVAELRDRIRRLGLGERVGLIPFQVEIAAIYRALDLVVHASTRPEPFGLTIAEAMACARPVIVSAAGGAAELVTHGEDAFAISPGDVEQLADAMASLAADANLRLRLGKSARQTALQRFNRDRLGPRLLDVYRRLIRA